MFNLLQCNNHTVALLFPLCDALTTAQLNMQQTDYFLSPICLSIVYLFADLQVFVGLFLRKLDTDDAIVTVR